MRNRTRRRSCALNDRWRDEPPLRSTSRRCYIGQEPGTIAAAPLHLVELPDRNPQPRGQRTLAEAGLASGLGDARGGHVPIRLELLRQITRRHLAALFPPIRGRRSPASIASAACSIVQRRRIVARAFSPRVDRTSWSRATRPIASAQLCGSWSLTTTAL